MLTRTAIFLLLACTLAAPAGAQVWAVNPAAGRTFDGWGTALAWEPRQIEQLPLPQDKRQEIAGKLLDILFTTKPVDLGKGAPIEGLGLNGLRYVIQGGQNPGIIEELHERARNRGTAFCERCWSSGWQPQPGIWDDSAEPAQRAWLQGAVERIRARGLRPMLMATAGAPPYWMTLDGSAAGAPEPLKPNLDARGVQQFAAYQVGVLERLKRQVAPGASWGVEFDLLGPLNEPNNNSWTKYNNQEGLYLPHAQQADLIRAVAAQLKQSRLNTIVGANDDSRIGEVDAYNSQFSALGTFEDIARDPARADVLNLIGEITVHTYLGDRRAELAALARRLGKPILVSEAGCCTQWSDRLSYKDSFGAAGAFWMADHVRRDILELGARGWFLWQPDWGILQVKADGQFDDFPQFWMLRFIISSLPANSRLLDSGNPDTIVSIEDRGAGHGVLRALVINTRFGPPAGATISLDLGRFDQLAPRHAYRAVASGASFENFRFEAISAAALISAARILSIPVAEQSVTEVTLDFACRPDCAQMR